MERTKTTHLLLTAVPAWGHIRPLLVLATRMLLERDDLVFTVLLSPDMIDKAQSDLATHFQHESLAQQARDRIRVVAAFDTNTKDKDFFKIMVELVAAYPAAYRTLLQEKPIICAKTGTVFTALPAPTAIVMDVFGLEELRATREVTGNTVPVVCWISTTAASAIRTCGPKEIGGLGEFDIGIEAEIERTGRPAAEISEDFYRKTDGSLINVAGIPPMYDHEFFPQQLPVDIPMAPLAKSISSFFKESDGIIVTTCESYEKPETIQALKEWINGWGKPTFTIGPLLPLGYGSSSVSHRDDEAVESFLEKCLLKYGEKSVLFISFGTVFWPTKTEYIEELIEALIEKEFPFIFCYASPYANMPDNVHKKVEASGLGLLTKWAPQQYILHHKSVGCFLTHGGHGGNTEALAVGVPLIGWPFTADQPIGIAQLAENQKVAIELVEVRTGEKGLNPIRRLGDHSPSGTREAFGREIREVINLIRGKKGLEMRQNAERMKKEIAHLWEEGGIGKREIAAFLEKIVDSRAQVAA